MDILYVDILTGENFSFNKIATMKLIYWPVRSSSKRGGDGVKRINGKHRYCSQLRVSLY